MTAPGVYLLAMALSHTILWARGPILLMLTPLIRMRAIYTCYITRYIVIIIYVANVTLLHMLVPAANFAMYNSMANL